MRKALIILSCLLFFIVKSGWAACTYNGPAATTPMPLQLGNITVGAEIADGTLLFKQTYNLDLNADRVSTDCTGSGQFYAYYSYSTTPLPPSSWSGVNAGKVYETGVPGIGVYIGQGTNSDLTIPDRKELTTNVGSGACNGMSCLASLGFKRWDLHFIKTGPVAPGTIQGSQLPCVQLNYSNESPTSDNLVENVCMTGAINIVASSCQTPDVTVEMGSHPVTDFSGVNSATGWVDASIKLTDCPIFYGYGASGNWYADSSGTNGQGTPTNNRLELKLTPNTSVIDSSNGIFAVIDETSSASGVGIQLAYGTSASQTMVNFGSTNNYEMTNNSSGNVTMPLVARYIQTDTNVVAGQANSAVTFLINYY